MRWDGTGTASRGSPSRRREEAPLVAVHGHAYILGPSGGEGSGHAEPIRSEPSGHTFADATLTSAVSSPSCFAVGGAANGYGGDGLDGKNKASMVAAPLSGTTKNNNDEEESHNNKSNVSLGSTDCFGISGAGAIAAATRPNSAGLSTARDTSFHPPEGNKAVRPHTSGPRSQGRARNCSVSGESECPPNSIRPLPEKGGYSVTSWPSDGCPDAKSSTECRASVSVVLPMLEEASDAGDKR